MTKAHVTDMLSDYLEGALSHAGVEKVKAHLAFCNACRQALTETEHHINLLKSTPTVRVPAGLEARVLSRVHKEIESGATESSGGGFSWPSWFTPLRGLALAATCGIVVLVVRNIPKDFEADRPAAVEDQEKAAAPVEIQKAETAEKANAAGETRNEIDADVKKKAEVVAEPSKDLGGAAVGAGGPAPVDAVAKGSLSSVGGSTDRAAEKAPANQPVPAAKKVADEIARPVIKEAAKPAPWAVPAQNLALRKTATPPPAAPAVTAESKALQAPASPSAAKVAPAEDKSAAKLEKRAEVRRDAGVVVATATVAPSPMEGSRSAIDKPLETVVSSQAEWENLWRRHTANIQPPPALPTVDFKTQQVVGIFAGERPTSGFRVNIIETSKTTWNGDTVRVVRYRIVAPLPGVMAAQVISYPYLLVIQPRFDGQTFFQKRP